jgi:hypothetical protein
MKKSGLIAIILLIIFGQCTEEKKEVNKRNPGYPVQVEFINGIKTVMNPNFPRDGRINYKIANVIILGDERAPEEGKLFFPYDIRVDSHYQIYVLDAEDVNIKIYDKNGIWLRNVGRRGQGPGEFTTISDFDVSHDGKIFILDTQQYRVLILNPDGTSDSSFMVKGSCLRLKVDKKGHVYLQQNISFIRKGDYGSHDMEMILKRTDTKGKSLFEYGRFHYLKFVWSPKRTERGTRIISHQSREAHTTVWIVGKGGKLYVGYSGDYLVTVLDRRGKPSFKFGRKFTPIKHPFYSPDLAHPKDYPAFYSRYLFIDDEENLWLKQYEENDKLGHLYDVFSKDGIFIRQAVVPERILHYQNGKAYTIVETKSGEYVAKCYKLQEVKTTGS